MAQTKLFLGIYEPHINIFLSAGEEMGEMMDVELSTEVAETVVLADENSDYPYGWVTQDVTTTGVTQYGLNGLITRGCKVGNKVGVYVGGGVLKTDKVVGDVSAGDPLYVASSGEGPGSTGGYVSAEPSSGDVIVGYAETDLDSDNIVRFKNLL